MELNDDEIPGADAHALWITPSLSIPRGELATRATRSSGAGGQHVNKTSSRIELTWNANLSPSISDEQRSLILTRLRSRITKDGDIRVVASTTRSQFRNREIAEKRLATMIANALVPVKKRRATKPTRASRQARLDEKKKHSTKKKERRPPVDE